MTRRGSLSSPKSSSRFHLRTLVSMSARWLSPRECSVETPSAFRSRHGILLPLSMHPSAIAKHPSAITQAPFYHHPSTLLPSPKHPSDVAKTSFLHCPSTLLPSPRHSFCIAQAPFLLCGNIHLAVQNNLNCGAIQLILPCNSICFAVQINSFCIREGFFLQRTDVHPVMQKGVFGTAKKTVRQRWKD